ncbi:MAG: segregation/condensation protein A [Pseudomonadota bacterium]|nr:segregation/condensation protein A [Pseudomonadota bacterium]
MNEPAFFPPAHQRALYAVLEEQFYVLLDSFEGPLDLLLFLVKKNRVSIENMPVVSIARQYLAYLELMEEMNLSIASEYLLMAATLIQIKSRILLRQQAEDEDSLDEQGEDPREEIIARLQAYELYKKGAEYLARQPLNGWDCFSPGESGLQDLLEDESRVDVSVEERYAVSMNDLLAAFLQLYERRKADQERHEIVRDLINIDEICCRVNETLSRQVVISFSELVERFSADTSLLIVLFLALLELVRQKRVAINQETPLEPLIITAGASEVANVQ